MSRANVELVLDQFAATNERDFERAMTFYAEGVELVVHPQTFLVHGTFTGREAVGRCGRASGVEVHGRTGYLYTVCAGEIVRAELFATPAAALAAFSER